MMTRKEQFAAAALQGLCANSRLEEESTDQLAEWAYQAAGELEAAFELEVEEAAN